jgi:hypothetical protein
MPSPFPGMDPWLERHWGDIHTSIVTYCRDHLQEGLPSDLRARVEEHVVLEADVEEDLRLRMLRPDAKIVEYPRQGLRREENSAVATLEPDEPIIVRDLMDRPVLRSVEIRDFATGGRLITVIEVLSPANKSEGAGRDMYFRKRRELSRAGVHLVEIDLLRSGTRIEPCSHKALADRDTTYLVAVTREDAEDGRQFELYPIPLRRRLPVVKIPLRPTDRDALLPLQAILNEAYDRGGYDVLDYRSDPQPRLEGPDAEWADALLREKKLR